MMESMSNKIILIIVDKINCSLKFILRTPKDLEDVSKYPKLFDRLYESREGEPTWTRADLEKLAGRNLIRVFEDVEKVRDSLKSELPSDMTIDGHDLEIAMKNEGLAPGACQTANE